jgi:hypothetical protein
VWYNMCHVCRHFNDTQQVLDIMGVIVSCVFAGVEAIVGWQAPCRLPF